MGPVALRPPGRDSCTTHINLQALRLGTWARLGADRVSSLKTTPPASYSGD